VSIFEFFIIIFVIISGILIFVIVPIVLKYLEKQFSIKLAIDYDFFYLRQVAIFSILTISTSVLYYALPNAKQKIWQTIPGSILAVILWITLVDFFSLYLENFDQMNFVYGSIAGVIISLMFFYLISLVFIFGAEFNYNFHRVYQFFLKKPKIKNNL
jgi:membrane protein